MNKWKLMLAILAVNALGGCVPYSALKPEKAAKLLNRTMYGQVGWMGPMDAASVRAHCAAGTAVKIEGLCDNPDGFEFVVTNIAWMHWRDYLKMGFIVPKSANVQKGDILQFKVPEKGEDPSKFLRVASHNDRPDCRWDGTRIPTPLVDAGVVCDGWSWREIEHVNW